MCVQPAAARCHNEHRLSHRKIIGIVNLLETLSASFTRIKVSISDIHGEFCRHFRCLWHANNVFTMDIIFNADKCTAICVIEHYNKIRSCLTKVVAYRPVICSRVTRSNQAREQKPQNCCCYSVPDIVTNANVS